MPTSADSGGGRAFVRRVASILLVALAGAALALGTRSGEIAGTTSYLPEEQLFRFTPARK